MKIQKSKIFKSIEAKSLHRLWPWRDPPGLSLQQNHLTTSITYGVKYIGCYLRHAWGSMKFDSPYSNTRRSGSISSKIKTNLRRSVRLSLWKFKSMLTWGSIWFLFRFLFFAPLGGERASRASPSSWTKLHWLMVTTQIFVTCKNCALKWIAKIKRNLDRKYVLFTCKVMPGMDGKKTIL